MGAGGKGARVKRREVGPRTKGKTKKTAEIVKVGAGPSTEKRPAPRPHRCREYARKRFAEELPLIVDRFAEGARDGDVTCLKALLTLSGFDKEETHGPQARRRRGFSFAKMLRDDLRRNPVSGWTTRSVGIHEASAGEGANVDGQTGFAG